MIENTLIKLGQEYFETNEHRIPKEEYEIKLKDLVNYPHCFVLACCMDRQIKADKAWIIPYEIEKELGSIEMEDLVKVPLSTYKEIFNRKKLHRFNDSMAEIFYSAVQKIHNEYNDNASLIWSDNPSSAEAVYRFLQFKGVGIKIATMAVNILAREYHISFSDYAAIDASPHTHVITVMYRLGLIKEKSRDMAIYKAKAIYPEYPGIIDSPLFNIGIKYCFARNPNCKECIMNDECKKVGIE